MCKYTFFAHFKKKIDKNFCFWLFMVSLLTSTCNTKRLEEIIWISSSLALKLQLKQAEEGQVYFNP